MLNDFLGHLNPRSDAARFSVLKDLVALEMGPQETVMQFMRRVRDIGARLQGLSVSNVLHMFALSRLPQER